MQHCGVVQVVRIEARTQLVRIPPAAPWKEHHRENWVKLYVGDLGASEWECLAITLESFLYANSHDITCKPHGGKAVSPRFSRTRTV